MADPAPCRRGADDGVIGGGARCLSAAARGGSVAPRNRAAAVHRRCAAVAGRRVRPRRPRQARGFARAGGIFRHVRTAACLYPPAPLFAVCRTGVCPRRCVGDDCLRHRVAHFSTGIVAAGTVVGRPFSAGGMDGRMGGVARADTGAGRRRSAGLSAERRAGRGCGPARPVRDAPRLRDHRPRRAGPAPRRLSPVAGAGAQKRRRGDAGRRRAVRILSSMPDGYRRAYPSI